MSVLWPIVKHALRTPRRVAVIDDHGRYSFGQLLGGAMFLAEQIESVSSAKHVGIMLPTSGGFPTALLGAWLSRRVAIPLNYLLSPEELSFVIRDSDIDTIVTAGPMLEFLDSVAKQDRGNGVQPRPIPSDIKLLRIDQTDFSGGPPIRWPPLFCEDDLAVILYTSGTSGQPKGVMLTHGNLHSNVDAAADHAKLTEQDLFLGVLPQFHSFGLTGMTLLPLRIGATTIYSSRFVPKKMVALIRKHKPSVMMAVPSMYGALLTAKNAQAKDFASIRMAVSGGEPLPQTIFEQCRDRLELHLLEGYGLTETSPMTNWCTPRLKKRNSVGTALPGVTIMIADEEDRPLPIGQKGQILIAGPNVMKGYYKRPHETNQALVDLQKPTAQRFLKTGDIGKLDHDGFLYITGRQKEMLIIGGENVFPREIEEILNRHPSVRDTAVIGKPDQLRGELPVAFVEIDPNTAFDEGKLRSWCRQHLAGFKVPRQIHRVETLPRNATGKIMRRRLKKEGC